MTNSFLYIIWIPPGKSAYLPNNEACLGERNNIIRIESEQDTYFETTSHASGFEKKLVGVTQLNVIFVLDRLSLKKLKKYIFICTS